MGESDEREAALRATRAWPGDRAEIAMRAAHFVMVDKPESLDSIAADFGVSRETVRRAREQLLREIGRTPTGDEVPNEPGTELRATTRALRRVLTMTGALPRDELLRAWARAAGKYPYSPLPTDAELMSNWLAAAGGFKVMRLNHTDSFVIDVTDAEPLDAVGSFVFEALRARPGGVDRFELLESAEAHGLKASTIANALSIHPAVVRISRGLWALRRASAQANVVISQPRPKPDRLRPTTFSWSRDGQLIVEFSIPRAPSPVIAVPKAIAALLEGREFHLPGETKTARITVSNARLWGFGPLVSESRSSGRRAQLAFDLVNGTASFNQVDERTL